MKQIINAIIFTMILSSSAFCQDKNLFDRNKVTSNNELNFAITNKRGIETKVGIIYYVEKGNQVLIAIEKGKIKWQTNIIKKSGMSIVGTPEIRYIRLEKNIIYVTFGKHSFATVDIVEGKTIYLESD